MRSGRETLNYEPSQQEEDLGKLAEMKAFALRAFEEHKDQTYGAMPERALQAAEAFATIILAQEALERNKPRGREPG